MIKYDFPKSCQNCPHIFVASDSRETKILENNTMIVETEIYCGNRDFCRFYLPDEE